MEDILEIIEQEDQDWSYNPYQKHSKCQVIYEVEFIEPVDIARLPFEGNESAYKALDFAS